MTLPSQIRQLADRLTIVVKCDHTRDVEAICDGFRRAMLVLLCREGRELGISSLDYVRGWDQLLHKIANRVSLRLHFQQPLTTWTVNAATETWEQAEVTNEAERRAHHINRAIELMDLFGRLAESMGPASGGKAAGTAVAGIADRTGKSTGGRRRPATKDAYLKQLKKTYGDSGFAAIERYIDLDCPTPAPIRNIANWMTFERKPRVVIDPDKVKAAVQSYIKGCKRNGFEMKEPEKSAKE